MIETILQKEQLSHADLCTLLATKDRRDMDALFAAAYQTKLKYVGNKVYYRGLIEFSNVCTKDCYYCGIRSSNTNVLSFNMSEDEIVEAAIWTWKNRYGSVTLQSGEREDADFTDFVERLILRINEETNNELGITLCIGEQEREVYERWFAAGSHRYLLRIETTNPELFAKIHPQDGNHNFERRLACIKTLQEVGFQVGTGVMIGLPGQTIEDLANDIMFFKAHNIDMIGMGPYIVSSDTPMGQEVLAAGGNSAKAKRERFLLGLKMVAVTRLYLKDVNIAATTALQALNPVGREKGLQAGANILMPIVTTEGYRENYQLYDEKPCVEDTADECKDCLAARVTSVGDEIGFGERGDSPHFFDRQG
ncbi:[FeFe] hydrogenase H-cluster radical SAM maturase HydE [Culicoidibacter larvae]|uniref:[FeFe] hydrogenase H-cluster radical SAM maturase HydE n=1 Tax=Culicoidibacter larvae TaxID=2579976 RepID=A0A5R8Q9K3_9FIRM|nr:[FeFe] hydrogenase H-cluster radical SAM maturase HydE [Culicoidibacter larvae]TLG72117.1 [FeFe] hydrogenase H-cluster radical SAM maturase HydE [Culicoidibacter larvae]